MTFLQKLLHSDAPPPAVREMDPDFVEDVVSAYCYVFEFHAPVPGCVADVAELPYSKQTIKDALRARLLVTSDTNFRDSLKVAYVGLADWQEGVGPDHRGLDPARLPEGLHAEERAARIVEQAIEGDTWRAKSNSEARRLHRELAALDL